MALGNNLKKKKLIPNSEEEPTEKKTPKKSVSPKKQVARKATSKRGKSKAEEKKPVAKRKESQVKSPVPKKTIKEVSKKASEKSIPQKVLMEPQPSVTQVEVPKKELVEDRVSNPNPELPMYIAKELLERKKELKSRYELEVKELKGKAVQFVVLTVGGEKYALDIDNVREVVPLPTVSKTPNTPEHIKGIVNVRGNNYVVFDLSTKFKVMGEEFARYLLILDDKDLHTSIPLSILPTTFTTNGDQISLSPQLIEDALLDASYIKGLIQDGDDLIYYLDIIELLKNDRAIVVPDKLLNEQDD